MQYFGVPRCPYCKKRVNLIRTWSLKRQGEYQCPRCGGISNVFLSPLIYVLALLAVFSSGAIYFFHKFVLDDVDLTTCLQVAIPFAAFFLLSLFMVYLAKPVIKRVSREELEKKRKASLNADSRRASVTGQSTGRVFTDQGDYLPPADYRTGPFPQPQAPVAAPRPQPVREAAQPTAVLPQQPRRAVSPSGEPVSPAAQRRQTAQRTAAQGQARRQAPPVSGQTQARVSSQQRETPRAERQSPPPSPRPAAQPRREASPVQRQAPSRPAPQSQPARRPSHVVHSVEIPSVTDDFFKRYDDPAYVERRLKELEEKKGRS